MMKLLSLLTTTALTTATQLHTEMIKDMEPLPPSLHRELSGDISYDDDFWNYNKDVDVSSQTIWTDYNYLPTKCMV